MLKMIRQDDFFPPEKHEKRKEMKVLDRSEHEVERRGGRKKQEPAGKTTRLRLQGKPESLTIRDI